MDNPLNDTVFLSYGTNSCEKLHDGQLIWKNSWLRKDVQRWELSLLSCKEDVYTPTVVGSTAVAIQEFSFI